MNKEGFTHEEWMAAERVDFSLTEEQTTRLNAAIDALKELGHEFDIPVHIQACVSYADGLYTLVGNSTFTNPARIPIEMLASHLLATGEDEKAVDLLISL